MFGEFWVIVQPIYQPLQPNICVLLDVGTRPHPKSIYHLWKAFDKNSNVGGACGEIRADTGKHGSALLNPIVASQKWVKFIPCLKAHPKHSFEYKMSNILDKPTESIFGGLLSSILEAP